MTVIFESRDLDKIVEFCCTSYAASRFSPRQVEPHRFRITQDPLGPVSLDRTDFGFEMDYTVNPVGRFCVFVMESGTFPRWDIAGVHHSLGPGEVFLATLPDRPVTGRCGRARFSATMLEPSLLSRVAATAPSHTDDKPVQLTGHRPISPAAGQHLLHTITFLRDHVLTTPAIRNAPLIASTAPQLLGATVLATFPNTACTDPTIEDRHDSHPATLRRAVAYIDDHVHEDISVADIAAAARTTIRAVQYAFRRHLATTPMGYLRQARLQHAHQDLLAADSGSGATVTEIAARWGFFHPGRFAHHYRIAYGDPPYRTLLRET
ncbi:helix-turn-helix domain-containing protein [Amycolatopsis sp. NPDC049868]|uniref:helix-turn-helix domain-containing protein n=1 Tax=Amycolatopsis sp. NPDC049868 TaxID=3363934 RepID=UPI0037B367E5